MFKFENLTIFIAFPLSPMEREPNSSFFNLIWRLNEPGDPHVYFLYFTVSMYHTKMYFYAKFKSSMLGPEVIKKIHPQLSRA